MALKPSEPREALLERPLANGPRFSATGTPHSVYTSPCVRWQRYESAVIVR